MKKPNGWHDMQARPRLAGTGRLAAAAAVAAVVAVSAAPAFADGAPPLPERARVKPTVVLVHGTNVDSSSWDGVAGRLRRDGYPVVVIANPLRGLSYDASYTKSVLRGIKGPIVLVGHSYGSAVVNEAALGNRSVEAVVAVAGFLPDKGESSAELVAKYPGSTLARTVTTLPYPRMGGGTGMDVYVKQELYPQQFAADVPLRVSSVMALTQRPVDSGALGQKATGAAWRTVPAYDLITADDRNIPAAAQRWMARRAHAVSVEIRSSHVAPVSHPDAVTGLIERAARGGTSAGSTLAATGGTRTWLLTGAAVGAVAFGGSLMAAARRRRRT
ncbi:alpha/beta hydrolase [Streptacidiphilus sp. ASG 303]|uniref:alpha/beta hydrolase n=1 Tax=Streptacidiphilus sp. ASG 303 TaxID=2896847 RepID=UPI001E3FECF4|nr:alpha/beta hydrolase [Streptacidiphilus sp. ASG 303]MCD0484134.1 alpha/beta hydrolase [Streptacidiphilus sp. ASG 303]